MKKLKLMGLMLLLAMAWEATAQDETGSDTLQTPFRKGRWFTGLSGSISSNNSQLNNSGTQNFTSQYSLDFFNGRLTKGRWLPGLRLSLSRSNSNEFGESESETLFVGPGLYHYLMKNRPEGSVYVTGTFGYARFFQRTEILAGNSVARQVLKGDGFGGEVGLGYAYAITDNILFDLGFTFSNFQISAKQTVEPSTTPTDEDLSFGGIAFRFGFNVLLDDFFF